MSFMRPPKIVNSVDALIGTKHQPSTYASLAHPAHYYYLLLTWTNRTSYVQSPANTGHSTVGLHGDARPDAAKDRKR
jgi:hypothetical protein